MKTVTLNVKRVVVIMSNGTDKIMMEVDAPTAFPEMRYEPCAEFEARHGYGAQWVRQVFGIEPEVIDTDRHGQE